MTQIKIAIISIGLILSYAYVKGDFPYDYRKDCPAFNESKSHVRNWQSLDVKYKPEHFKKAFENWDEDELFITIPNREFYPVGSEIPITNTSNGFVRYAKVYYNNPYYKTPILSKKLQEYLRLCWCDRIKY